MIIYGRADIARELGVSAPAVSNWIRRHADTPVAQFRTPDGVMFWDFDGRERWVAWDRNRKSQVTAAPAGTEVGTNLEVDSKG